MEIAIVVAADEMNGIGINNQLLCHLPNDLKYFKQLTTGHAILMGRKTYDSIGRPLPNRLNLVLSKSQNEIAGCETFSEMETAINFAKEKGLEKLYIIGGDSVYKQGLALCDKVYLTRIHHSFLADAFFVALLPNEWKLQATETAMADEKNAYAHSFEVYQKM